MKLILAGSTGFVGSEVLKQCQKDTSIDSLVVLTRKPLSEKNTCPKTNNIIIKDFKQYSPDIIEAIRDADACIWTLGGSGSFEVEVEYPLALTAAIRNSWTRPKPFHFVHCSGVLAERDQTKSLWFLQDGRRAKGRAEIDLLQLATTHNEWQTYIMKPSMVVQKSPTVFQSILGYLLGCIRVDELANVAILLATKGYGMKILENKDLVDLYDGTLKG